MPAQCQCHRPSWSKQAKCKTTRPNEFLLSRRSVGILFVLSKSWFDFSVNCDAFRFLIRPVLHCISSAKGCDMRQAFSKQPFRQCVVKKEMENLRKGRHSGSAKTSSFRQARPLGVVRSLSSPQPD